MPIGPPGRRLSREPPDEREIIKHTFRVDREMDAKMRRRVLTLGGSLSEYLRTLIENDLNRAS
jgi:hypothetical protein